MASSSDTPPTSGAAGAPTRNGSALSGGRGLALVLLSFVLRLAAGLMVMVFMARAFGPTEFGQFVYWLAVATLVTVAVNMGLGTYVLREIGIEKNRYHAVMGAALSAKLVISAVVLLGCALACLVLPTADAWIFALLALAQLFDSFGEFFNLGFRRDGRYQGEALTAVLTSVLHLVCMGVAVAVWGHVLQAALAFALSRGVGLVMIAWRSMAVTGLVCPAPLRQVPQLLRATWAYGGELALNTAYSQVDTLLVNSVLGISGVGLYQAGMKMVDGVSRLAPVFAQFVLPTLASHRNSKQRFRRSALRVMSWMGAIGLVGGGLLIFFAEAIGSKLYGNQYSSLTALMPLFAALLCLRYLETACGLLLVARGMQHIKVWLVAVQFMIVLGFGYPALQRFGIPGWQWCVVGGLLVVISMYGLLLRRWRSDVGDAVTA